MILGLFQERRLAQTPFVLRQAQDEGNLFGTKTFLMVSLSNHATQRSQPYIGSGMPASAFFSAALRW
jgi:hypothetical protein